VGGLFAPTRDFPLSPCGPVAASRPWIAEIKKASPSQGVDSGRISIRLAIASGYGAGGPAACRWLTDKTFFQGVWLRCCGDGAAVEEAAPLPLAKNLRSAPPISLLSGRAWPALMRPAGRRDPQRPGYHLRAQGRPQASIGRAGRSVHDELELERVLA